MTALLINKSQTQAGFLDQFPKLRALETQLRKPRRISQVLETLTEDEIRVIERNSALNPIDYLTLTKVKKILNDPELEAMYEKCLPKDSRHYLSTESPWISQEQQLLQERSGHLPSNEELLTDFMNHKNGERFKTYYCLTNPNKIIFKD